MCLRKAARVYDDCTTSDHELARVLQEAFAEAEEMCADSSIFADDNIEAADYAEKLYDTPRVTVWLDSAPKCVEGKTRLPSGVDLVVREY